jgi:hypothetical protein
MGKEDVEVDLSQKKGRFPLGWLRSDWYNHQEWDREEMIQFVEEQHGKSVLF